MHNFKIKVIAFYNTEINVFLFINYFIIIKIKSFDTRIKTLKRFIQLLN